MVGEDLRQRRKICLLSLLEVTEQFHRSLSQDPWPLIDAFMSQRKRIFSVYESIEEELSTQGEDHPDQDCIEMKRKLLHLDSEIQKQIMEMKSKILSQIQSTQNGLHAIRSYVSPISKTKELKELDDPTAIDQKA